MSVRKREWTTTAGEKREAWIVDYADQAGERHIRTFDRKKDADAYHATVKVDVRHGVHTPPSKSVTVAEAAESWIKRVEAEGRERSTVAQYRQHVDLHIAPRIGRIKLSDLTPGKVETFRDELLAKLSRPLARKVLTSLKSLLKVAKHAHVAADVSIGRDKRGKRKLRVGVDIPTADEIKRILADAPDKWRRLLLVMTFTGLRASEARGLRWQDVDFKRSELHVRQRADRYNAIGRPKSESSERTIPLGPHALKALKEWKLACPKGEHDLVFPSSEGTIIRLENIIRRGLMPAQIAAGVTVPVLDKQGKQIKDEKGKSVVAARYTGLHALRHFYASLCINRRADGGLELPPKVVQERLGHASIVMTMDIYGHLFPRSDDGAELAAAESALLA
jgi:integrase